MSLVTALLSPHKVYDLSVPLTPNMPSSASHTPFSLALTTRHGDTDRTGSGGTAANALIVTGDHVGTHIDALCHVANKGIMHGGIDAFEAQRGGKFKHLGAETIEPIVCRGVLLDIPRLKGVEVLEPGYGITDKDLDDALGDTSLNPGDVALIRTGWMRHFSSRSAFLGDSTGVPGLSESGGQWLADKKVRAAGADTITFDVLQLGPNWRQRPCHGILLWENGIHIIEVMDLEGLAKEGVREFVFVLAGLKVVGATGALCRPLAIVDA